ncbi:MAG TPA: DUF2207 domain-containing protein [Tenericutes bacterium]|nr:DUF2207 domain-containing protein [Mycoplasmatota bacterium]
MKKIYIKIILFLLLICPINAYAKEGIDEYYIDATVQENGDLVVKEFFTLTGTYNGMERIINYRSDYISKFGGTLSSFSNSEIYNGNSITMEIIKGVSKNFTSFNELNKNGDIFNKVSSATKGDYGKYVEEITSVGKNYLIYNPSKKNKAFYLEYTIGNLGIVHKDIAEIGWNIFTNMNEHINHLEIYIHIPNNTELLRAWAHGPYYGNIELIDINTLKITVDDLEANTAIDTRFVFDKKVINNSNKKTGVVAFDKIIEIETDLANKANLEREIYYKQLEENAKNAVLYAEENISRSNYQSAYYIVDKLKNGELKNNLLERLEIVLNKVEKKEKIIRIANSVSALGWTVGLVIIINKIYKKHDKEYESVFKGKYYRDFPEEYGPEIVGYLINKKISNNDLSAAILNLIYKKIITFIPADKNNKDFIFKKVDGVLIEQSEEKLVKFIFDSDDNNEIKLSELKKRANKSYDSFIRSYTDWKDTVKIEAEGKHFFEDKTLIKTMGVLYTILGIAIACIFLTFDISILLNVIIIILAVISLFYFISFTKRSEKGNEDYSKWMALKNFMNDFGRMDSKDLPEIVLWEKYLVYAVSLGCADKLSKTMKIKVQELQENNMLPNSTMFDMYYFNRILLFNNSIKKTLNTAVNSAYTAKNANSSSSSGGGFGGGFSGGSFGGGSFGGGGGGGRF